MRARNGTIPFQLIRDMMRAGYILGAQEAHIQPSSLDLSVTDEAYRLRGSYLPRNAESMQSLLERGSLFTHDLDRPLEQNGIYLIRLNESLALPPGIHATTSNKSSSGRINLRARLLADGVPRFDDVPAGYRGSLWLEVIPTSFPVRIHPGDRINQMRFFHGDARLTPFELRLAYDEYGLLRDASSSRMLASSENMGNGVTMTVDLSMHDIVGWKAKAPAGSVLDTARTDHDPHDFFESVPRPKNGELIIRPGSFFILSTREGIVMPPRFSAEMAAYDASKGEFRSHFAGFFDPGWGWDEQEKKRGWAAVMEIEAYSHDFVLRDSQPICLMLYEHVLAEPEKLYGISLQSHYRTQRGPQLAKWFRNDTL